MQDIHFLDKGGDTWRVKPSGAAQALGPIYGGYKRVIPFCQQEFVNAFVKWVVIDNVKHRKATSNRLQRAFKIANMQSTNALP